MNWNIRPASNEDAERIHQIYRPHVEKSAVSFEWNMPTVEEMELRIFKSRSSHCWLVCEQDEVIAGFAYASEFRSRQAYNWATEVSVYVDPNFGRLGIAGALYTALEMILIKQGYRQMIAVMTSPNPPSRSFHLKFGFESVGLIPSVGYKFDEWYAIEILIKQLGEQRADVRKISQVDENEVVACCRSGLQMIYRSK